MAPLKLTTTVLTLLTTLATAEIIPSASFSKVLLPSSSSATPSATPSLHPNECLAGHTKQCCTSLREPTKEITDGLGQIVPWLKGVKINSLAGFGCTPLMDGIPCGGEVMCCKEPYSGDLAGTLKLCLPPGQDAPDAGPLSGV
ncbi:hypothetical protein PHISCL_02455 [Aspergillus sclerotialis]|uniref:Hydrophobin n=1 Tax=Aspergillus sclerotialis TaxID=2070753 RepID=A0A3A3A759_9EURO|nr:hypothetical protein PHISCL_02455 [Aspergillus sclerotialis]